MHLNTKCIQGLKCFELSTTSWSTRKRISRGVILWDLLINLTSSLFTQCMFFWAVCPETTYRWGFLTKNKLELSKWQNDDLTVETHQTISRLKVVARNPLSVSHVIQIKRPAENLLKEARLPKTPKRAKDKGRNPLDNQRHLQEISSYIKTHLAQVQNSPLNMLHHIYLLKRSVICEMEPSFLCLFLVICTSQTEVITTNNVFLFLLIWPSGYMHESFWFGSFWGL